LAIVACQGFHIFAPENAELTLVDLDFY